MKFMAHTNRRGITIIELTISMILVTLVMAFIGQAAIGMARQQRMVMQRAMATEEVANLMERASVLDWDELTPDRLQQWSMRKELSQRLPNSSLKCDVHASDDVTPAKRIAIELTWTNYAGDTTQPVRLVSWKYRREDSQ